MSTVGVDAAEDARRASASWWTGRSGLVVPAILAAFSTYLVVGIVTMQVPPGVTSPGPRFFPTLIAVAGYVVAVLLALRYLRTPEPAEPARYSALDEVSETARAEAEAAARVSYRTFSDWTAVGWAAGGFLAFSLLLMPAGWIVAGALLFWCVARSMGSRRPVVDLVVALMMSSLVYLAFGVVLGLNLPSGILGGL
ncbi:tripartite tricarboxylate transporter TctB family protein [Microbacterium betulae]|uniref:Tripartite tricarboxylate transporter TctB family protein n=1 Tax=Microbacterium betulae TaxID=2981139 RepID=A0AA97FHZ1_9MICO|nr:tripartite tricarboxylate transporter TctB family protein [Microbacterium sp. AB]WOF23576.1 tripartite tricarboxylate transporter TctB family protein [Microbacterium sp. AB]